MAEIKPDYGTGGAGLQPNQASTRHPALATVLRDVADDLDGVQLPDFTGWTTGAAVTTHVLALESPGPIIAVEGTTGNSTGPKSMVTGAPAQGQVQVAYDGDGVPTLTFNTTDAITAAAYVQLVLPPAYTIKTTKG